MTASEKPSRRDLLVELVNQQKRTNELLAHLVAQNAPKGQVAVTPTFPRRLPSDTWVTW